MAQVFFQFAMVPIRQHNLGCKGLTLIELMVVIVILAALGGLLVPLFNDVPDEAEMKATEASMRRVQEAIVGADGKAGYLADMRDLPRDSDVEPRHPRLKFLFVNPADLTTSRDFDPDSKRGWRGPYLLGTRSIYDEEDYGPAFEDYLEDEDEAVFDAWGNPMVIIQSETTDMWQLVSAGPDETLETADDLVLDLISESALP